MVRLTIFDLDRTLTRHGTWSPFLLHSAIRLAPWRLALVPAIMGAMLGYKLGLLTRRTLKQYMQRCMMGRSVDREFVMELADSFAETLVRKHCRSEALSRERAEGRRIFLASAAHCFYLEAIAARLGISEVIGTRCVWQEDRLLPSIVGENCYGVAKRDRLLEYLGEQRLDLGTLHIRFYSDDSSDMPLFEIVDQPIVVNASRKLRASARARGWSIIQWT